MFTIWSLTASVWPSSFWSIISITTWLLSAISKNCKKLHFFDNSDTCTNEVLWRCRCPLPQILLSRCERARHIIWIIWDSTATNHASDPNWRICQNNHNMIIFFMRVLLCSPRFFSEITKNDFLLRVRMSLWERVRVSQHSKAEGWAARQWTETGCKAS